MAKAFICYARVDAHFTDPLVERLRASGHTVFYDKAINPGEKWQKRIRREIAQNAYFIYVISPGSLQSPDCTWELALANRLRSKIAPIYFETVDERQIDEAVKENQWIDFRSDPLAFDKLLATLEEIPAREQKVREATGRAQLWQEEPDRKGADRAYLPRDRELKELEQVRADEVSRGSRLPQVVEDYILAGQRAQNARQRAINAGLWIGSAFLLIIALVIGYLAKTTIDANHVLAAEALAGQANSLLLDNEVDRALLLGAEAYDQDSNTTTRNALLSAVEFSPHLDEFLQSNSSGVLPFQDTIQFAGFSRDGMTLLTVSNNRIIAWDWGTRTPRLSFADDFAYRAAMSPDAHFVVTKGTHGITLWDTQTGQKIGGLQGGLQEPYGFNIDSQTVAISPDGTLIAAVDCVTSSCAAGQIHVWSVGTQRIVTNIPLLYPPLAASLTFSPNRNVLAFVETDLVTVQSHFTLWDATAGQILLSRPPPDDEAVRAIAYTPDGRFFALGGLSGTTNEGEIVLWDAVAMRPIGGQLSENDGAVTAVSFSLDNHWLVETNTRDTLRLWNVTYGTPLGRALAGHSSSITALAMHPDSNHFVTAGDDGKLLVWRVNPYTSMSLTPGGILDNFAQVAISPDGSTMATARHADGSIIFWNINTGTLLGILPGTDRDKPFDEQFAPYSMDYSHDGRYLAVGGSHGQVVIWDLAMHQTLGDPFVVANSFIQTVEFSRDGHLLLITGLDDFGRQTVTLWDVASQAIRAHIVDGNNAEMDAATLSPDGRLIATSVDATRDILLWDTKTNSSVGRLSGSTRRSTALAFSPDGHILAAALEDSEIVLWDMRSQQIIAHFTNSLSLISPVTASLAFSPDGTMLIFSHDKTIELWQLNQSSYALFVPPIITDQITFATLVSPDGRLLISAEQRGPIEVRYRLPADWHAQACAIAGHNLTQDDWNRFVGTDVPYRKICPALP